MIRGTWSPGSIHWHKEDVHVFENVGETAAKFLVFSRKYSLLPEVILDRKSYFAEILPDKAKIRIENDDVRVTEMLLEPGDVLPDHVGLGRLIFPLSDYTIEYKSDKIEAGVHSTKKGDIHWHDTDRYTLRNTGRKKAHFFIVVFKE